MKKHADSCKLVTLAQYDQCLVEYCASCKVIHLQLQFLTIKLEQNSLADLKNLLSQSEQRLAELEGSGTFTSFLNHSLSSDKIH